MAGNDWFIGYQITRPAGHVNESHRRARRTAKSAQSPTCPQSLGPMAPHPLPPGPDPARRAFWGIRRVDRSPATHAIARFWIGGVSPTPWNEITQAHRPTHRGPFRAPVTTVLACRATTIPRKNLALLATTCNCATAVKNADNPWGKREFRRVARVFSGRRGRMFKSCRPDFLAATWPKIEQVSSRTGEQLKGNDDGRNCRLTCSRAVNCSPCSSSKTA